MMQFDRITLGRKAKELGFVRDTFEKVCRLGKTIPAKDRQTLAAAGDVMLYNGTQIVFFYGSNSWSYTRLGKAEGLSAEKLEQILSGPETELTLSLN